jgi:hypothetical protein
VNTHWTFGVLHMLILPPGQKVLRSIADDDDEDSPVSDCDSNGDDGESLFSDNSDDELASTKRPNKSRDITRTLMNLTNRDGSPSR